MIPSIITIEGCEIPCKLVCAAVLDSLDDGSLDALHYWEQDKSLTHYYYEAVKVERETER